MLNLLNNQQGGYKSFHKVWDKFSAIRKRPRRILEYRDDGKYFYPMERQPISVHPLVKAAGDKMIWQILLHSAYKFLSDIAFVEMKVVNKISEKIYDGELDFNFPHTMRYDILSVIVDEAFHAYVAIDVLNQLHEATQVAPLPNISKENEMVKAYTDYTKGIVPAQYAKAFEVIALCVAENTLTKELFSMTKQENLNLFFHQIMADHMNDEGRHSQLFSEVLSHLWSEIDTAQKDFFTKILPGFIKHYQTIDLHVEYNRKLLKHLNFSQNDIEVIIHDTYMKNSNNLDIKTNPVIKNLTQMFLRSGIKLNMELLHESTSA